MLGVRNARHALAAMRCCVTGGAGFIGSHIVERLLKEGHEVVVLDDLSTGSRHFVPSAARLIVGDIRDPAALSKALDGVEAVFHQAALRSVPRSVKEPENYGSVNVEGTLKVLSACKKRNARFVFASSSSIYGENPTFPQREDLLPMPISPYAATKRAGELLARVFSSCYGLPTCSLRYFNVYGPRQDPHSEYAAVVARFLLRGLKGLPLEIHGDGEQSRDFTYVQDVAHANLLGAAKPFYGEVFNIAGGLSIPVRQIAELAEKLIGHPLQKTFAPARPGDVRKTWADCTLARTKLGFSPAFSFEAGLQEALAYFKSSTSP